MSETFGRCQLTFCDSKQNIFSYWSLVWTKKLNIKSNHLKELVSIFHYFWHFYIPKINIVIENTFIRCTHTLFYVKCVNEHHDSNVTHVRQALSSDTFCCFSSSCLVISTVHDKHISPLFRFMCLLLLIMRFRFNKSNESSQTLCSMELDTRENAVY